MFSLRVIPDHCRNGYSIQNIFKRLYFPAFNCLISASILLIFHISSIAQISVQFKQTGKKSSVESFVHDNHELISISSFAEALNYSCQWDRFSQRLTCRKNNDSISFVQDNTFIMRNGVTAKLSLAPLRFGSQLFLTITDLIEAFKPEGGELQWNASSRQVQVVESKYSIKRYFRKTERDSSHIDLGDSFI